MSQHPPVILATNDDGSPRFLERHLAVGCDDDAARSAILDNIVDRINDALVYWARPDGGDHWRVPSDNQITNTEGLLEILSNLHTMVIDRVTQARRLGNDAYDALGLPPVYLLISNASELFRHPDEGETEWFQQRELRTWALDRLVKLMSANRLAGITVVVADSLEGFDQLSETSLGHTLLMKVDALLAGESTPQSRSSLLRVQPDEDETGDLAADSATYVDQDWFHPVTLFTAGAETPDTTASQAVYDALAPVLGITSEVDDRLQSAAAEIADVLRQAGLDVPENVLRAYRRELAAVA